MKMIKKDESVLRRTAFIAASSGAFATCIMASSINVALPVIGDRFEADAVRLSWIATAYLLAAGIALVPMGRMADIYGQKKILFLGFCLFALASLLCAVAQSVEMLIFFRVLQGFGSGMTFGVGTALLASVFPAEERGSVFGATMACAYTGLSVGPFIGGLLTQYLTWRSLFGFIFLVSLIPLVLLHLKLKAEWAAAAGEDYDAVGAIIYAVTLIAFICGFSRLPDVMGIALLGVGALGFGAFIFRQLNLRHPLFEVKLFLNNRLFALSNLANMINFSATWAITFLLSLYLQYIKALDATTAGAILVAMPAAMACFASAAGRMSDKFEARILASAGMAMGFVSLFMLMFLDRDTGVSYVVSCLILSGIGQAVFTAPNINAIMGSVEKRYFGIAGGSSATMRMLGMMVSMGITTLVLTIVMGPVVITEAVYPELLSSIQAAFVIFCVICFFGIFTSFSRGSIRSTNNIEIQGIQDGT